MSQRKSERTSSPKPSASSPKRSVADTVSPASSIKLDDEDSRIVALAGTFTPVPPLSSPPAVLDGFQHVDEKQQRVVAVSIHSSAIDKEDLDGDITQMKSILNEKLSSRQCVAENKIVSLQDGVYVQLKKPSTKYKTNNLLKYNWFPTYTFRFCFHRQPWVTAGLGSTFLDAERVNAKDAKPPTPHKSSTPVSESPVAIVPHPGCAPSSVDDA